MEASRERPPLVHLVPLHGHAGEQVAEGRMLFNGQSPELKEIQKQLHEQRRQRYWLTTAATSVVAGSLIMTLGAVPWVGWALLGAGALAAYIARP